MERIVVWYVVAVVLVPLCKKNKKSILLPTAGEYLDS
jgi:hypothetical protein